MADSDDRKAGTIILRDLALFNKSAVFFETQIDPFISNKIGQAASSWLETRDWLGETDVAAEPRGLWVAPRRWADGKDDCVAWFMLSRRANSAGSSYRVADLFGVGQAEFGFRFKVEQNAFGGARAWKAYAEGLSGLRERLAGRGWVPEGNDAFFRPVILPADKLAAAWEGDDWEEALAPLVEALDGLERDASIFDAIIDGARGHAAVRTSPRGPETADAG
jgi:hypothetical protein